MAKYRITPSSRAIVQSPISIGHKAEKGVEAIEFDLTAWVETYGSGTLTVIMRRWGDAIPYPIALEIDENNKATWTLSDTDTAKAGMAYAQLSYIVGDEVVKKSDIYTFRVMDSLTGEGDPPEAYESWLEHLTHLAAEAMAEVLDIEGIATDKTLTVDGGIADAKATGDALALKADKSTTYTKAEVDQMIEDVEVETDATLEIAGAPADAAETGRQIGLLKADLDDKVDLPSNGYGTSGKILRSTGTGTEWATVGQPTDEQTAEAISDWLDEHPEATTTVQDGSLTEAKFSDALKKLVLKDYVTPEMFGAVGDGVTDDTEALQDCIDSAILNRKIVLATKNYKITSTVSIITSLNRASVASDVAYIFFTGRILCDNGRESAAFELTGNQIHFYANEIVDINNASDENDGYHGITDKSYAAIRLMNVGHYHVRFTRIVNFGSAILCDNAMVSDGYITGDCIQNCIYGICLCQQRSVINLMTINVGLFYFTSGFGQHLVDTETYGFYQAIPSEPADGVVIYGVDHIYMHRPCFSTGPSSHNTCFYIQLARNCRFDDLYIENGGANSKFAVFDMVYPNGVYTTTISYNNVFGFQETAQSSSVQNAKIEFLNLETNTVCSAHQIARHDYDKLNEVATIHAPFGDILDVGTNNKLVKNWVFYWTNNTGTTLSDNLVIESKGGVADLTDGVGINQISPGIKLLKISDTSKYTNIRFLSHGKEPRMYLVLFDVEKNVLDPTALSCGALQNTVYKTTVLQKGGVVSTNGVFSITILSSTVAYVGVLFTSDFTDVSVYSDNAFDVSLTLYPNLKYFKDKYVYTTTPRRPASLQGNAYIGQKVYDLNNVGQYWELGANGWTKVTPA